MFMEGPDCSVDNSQPEKICLLNRAIYDLKQPLQSWNVRLDKMLTSVGLKKFNNDPCICIKYKRNRIMTIIAVYVDELLVFLNDCSEKGGLKVVFKNEFQYLDVCITHYCLGINVERDRVKGEICLIQTL